ncbi:ImmA/IrrE family metallo-endopeptidase [Frigidibacter sp. ROC022]|uniref:ImmA/IrrE family metallo-endopeptidase n=1 Tax=Frigidibacter sp. ROC022 TaxID=2971796 RepID=UPI00215A415C|nr:ImmA/IrrE family metallo-endopeptidase [Frigidibacter sp. ROC022]MCR8725124.1 ImmA/IrrE family metallo-endopeptidase [Frigidibacter sp. ROC022]
MARVEIAPDVLRWARERSDLTVSRLAKKFKGYPEWEAGHGGPTFSQLDSLASFLHVPMGMFFLKAPPEERLTLPDFRKMPDSPFERPTPDLLDTIRECKRRQSWYRDYARNSGLGPLKFVGSASLTNDPGAVAAQVRATIGLEVGQRSVAPNWTEFLRGFIRATQEVRILVMVNGVVGNNTRRPLDPREFRGFAIADPIAPLVFINGADTKAAQIFSLAHEVAHIWLGESGVSRIKVNSLSHDNRVEAWCNKVAAEILVPMEQLARTQNLENYEVSMYEVARKFRVSTLVALRRIHEAGAIDRATFDFAYQEELERVLNHERSSGGSGGNFYNTINARVDRRFAEAVICSTIEGRTLVGDALNLLSIKNTGTLKREAQVLGYSF